MTEKGESKTVKKIIIFLIKTSRWKFSFPPALLSQIGLSTVSEKLFKGYLKNILPSSLRLCRINKVSRKVAKSQREN